ncbi:MAG: metallophosphoesterase family protein [Armatimonadota bacterium]
MTEIARTAGIIGDVHGEDAALEAALSFLLSEGPFDAILCTGDLPAKRGIGDADRSCALLREANVLTIRGNHDRWHVENEEVRRLFGDAQKQMSPESQLFLRSRPPLRELETTLGTLLLCHGIAQDDMSGIYPGGPDEDVSRALESYGLPGKFSFMVNGHTHRRMVRPLSGLTILNAGSLCWNEHPGFLIADFTSATVHFFDLTPFTYQITAAGSMALPA